MSETAILYSANRYKGGCWIFKNKRAPNTCELFTLTLSGPLIYSVCVCVCAQSCLTLCSSRDCSSPGSSIHGILQARILEWVAIPFSRGSSQPRDWNRVSCIAGKFFTIWTTSLFFIGMHFLSKELNQINSVVNFLDHQVSSLEHPICRTVLGTGYTVINKADALSALLEFAVQ